MKQAFGFILTLFAFSLQAQSIETVLPSNVVDLSISIFDDRDYSVFGKGDCVNIYNLEVDGDSVYSMVGVYYISFVGLQMIPDYYFQHYRIFQTDRVTASHVINPTQIDSPKISNISHAKDSAIVNDTEIPLENSYSLQYKQFIDGETVGVEYHIERLAIQKKNQSNNLIGGLVKWTTSSSDLHYITQVYTANLWNLKGKHIWSDKIRYANIVPGITELRFMHNEKFLTFNMSGEERIVDNNWFLIPFSYLIEVETFEFLPANRDVAFSSDEKYYVTERDGLPSLVDAETHDVLLRYDPGMIMTACGFSPDDARLYIACEDLKVYEFSSHVPDTAVEDWAVFE